MKKKKSKSFDTGTGIGNFIKNNPLYIAWFVMYFMFTWAMFGRNIGSFVMTFTGYMVSLLLILSEPGEHILRFIYRVRQLETKREKYYLIPMFKEVYATAAKRHPELRRDIEICIIDEMRINACAMGLRTIAVTKGAIDSLSEEELKGFMAHELGHISHGDTIALLLTTVGNGVLTIVIVAAKTAMNIIRSMLDTRGFAGVILNLLNLWFHIMLFYILYVGEFLMAINSRRNEYAADRFAFEIGYGDDLVSALYLLQDMSISDNARLSDRLKASHPHIAKRIGRLEYMVDEADAGQR